MNGCAWCGIYWDKPLYPEDPESYCSPQCVVSDLRAEGKVVKGSTEINVDRCYLDRRTWGMGETIYYRKAK